MSKKPPDRLPDFLLSNPKMVTKVWGGSKLNLLFSKGDSEQSGESWEVADLEEGQSSVDGYDLTLNDFVNHFGKRFLGTSDKRFPLLNLFTRPKTLVFKCTQVMNMHNNLRKP